MLPTNPSGDDMDTPDREPGQTQQPWSRAENGQPGSPPAASAAPFVAVLEAALDAIITIDHEGRVLHFNPAAERLFGYRHDEALGRDIDDLLTPPEPPGRGLRWHVASATGPIVVQRLEMLARRADGGVFPVALTVARLPSEGPPAFTGYVRDLTEQKRAEAALRQSEESYRELVENANDIIYTHDLSGTLTSWNRAGEHILGYTAEETRGMNIARLVAPEHLERARQMTARKVAQGGRTAYELDVFTKDGRRVTVEISSRLARQPGLPPQVQGMARDVTERKRAEQALKETDRKKDEFLATLAHELRNPLAPIRNALQILRLAGDNRAAVAHVHEVMERQVDQMIRLVDDLLDVSRITRGKIELRRERLELGAVVRSALETSRPLIESARHELTVLPPPGPLAVEGDKTRLAQVVSNLLNNSAKYTPEGGHIWLTVERSGGQAVVRVRDNGMGIPAEMLSHVFEMFTQLDKSRHRSQGGLGIGLTLVRNLVAMHGGTVEAHSDGPGKGSEFVVRLPLAPEEPRRRGAEGPDGASRRAATPARRLLVVDDNVASAESLAMMLRLMGNEVCTAHDGPSALGLAATFAPDVVLLDIGMPGMDGYEVARRLRAMSPLKEVVVVAQTGWGQDEDRRRSVEAGFDHHLVKPVDPAALQDLLARLPCARA
jgi:PAS domain S-box-containing protein